MNITEVFMGIYLIDILFTIIGLVINLYFVSVFKLSKFK